MRDSIKRSDAIKAVEKRKVKIVCNYESNKWFNKMISEIEAIPSADRPTVIRVKSIMKKEDYESLAESIRQQDQNVIVIPHNAELATPVDRPQGNWILFPMGYLVCSVCGSHHSNSKPCNYCDNCGAKMRGGKE